MLWLIRRCFKNVEKICYMNFSSENTVNSSCVVSSVVVGMTGLE